MAKFNADAVKLDAHVEAEIKKLGYFYPSASFITAIPEEDKMFDLDLSSMHQDELLRKLGIFTSLYASASVDESRYAAQVATLKRDLENAKANAFKNSDAKTNGEREKDEDTDKDVVEIQEKLSLADSLLSRFTALRGSYDKFSVLYSRAITVLMSEQGFSK
jgi:hypothetical protein